MDADYDAAEAAGVDCVKLPEDSERGAAAFPGVLARGEALSRIWMKGGPSITTMALMPTLRRRKCQVIAEAQVEREVRGAT